MGSNAPERMLRLVRLLGNCESDSVEEVGESDDDGGGGAGVVGGCVCTGEEAWVSVSGSTVVISATEIPLPTNPTLPNPDKTPPPPPPPPDGRRSLDIDSLEVDNSDAGTDGSVEANVDERRRSAVASAR